MTSADPTGMHDWHSDGYVRDWIDAQLDEERGVLLRQLVQLIPRDPDSDIRVLDMGAGYGALANLLLEAFPHARVVLHDYSEPMLAEARARFASLSDSVSYYRGDLMTPEWARGLEGEFDAVVSSIAIHNVRYPARIRAIYAEIFPLVKAGGCFLNFDQVATAGFAGRAERHAQLMERRRRAHEETGQWRPLDAIESETRRSARAPAVDSGDHEPATLTNQLRWLIEAGFDEAECFWREGRRAIMGGFRAT